MRNFGDYARAWRLLKEFGAIVGSQILSIFLNLALVRLLTEYLDKSQYGQMVLALSIGTLICQVAFSGSMPGIFRYYSIAVEQGKLAPYFCASGRLVRLAVILALLLVLSIFWGATFFVTDFNKFKYILLVACLFSILVSCNSVISLIQSAARRRMVVAFHANLELLMRTLLILALLFCKITPNCLYVLESYFCILFVVVISQLFFLRPLIPSLLSVNKLDVRAWIQKVWLYSKPFVIFNFFTWACSYSDRWALGILAGTKEVGLYAVLIQLGYTPIVITNGLLMNFMSPILFKMSGDATDIARVSVAYMLIMKLIAFIFLLTTVGFIFTFVFHKAIFGLFVQEDYREVSYLLPWIVLGAGTFVAGQVLTEKIQCVLDSKSLIYPKIISSIVGVGLNFIFVYYYGLKGTVLGIISYSIFYCIWIGIIGQRIRQGLQKPKNKEIGSNA